MTRKDIPHGLPPRPKPKAQHGAALIVALILLLIMTILGLASMRSTIMEERMSASLYDRNLAFQAAEAALRAAEAAIRANTAVINRNCADGVTQCDAVPVSNEPGWQSVATSDFDAGPLALGQPRYFIEDMGTWPDPDLKTGFEQTAAYSQYGAERSATATYYRVTVQSDDPATAAAAGRALVTLQATIKE